jgi:hypothetical protein
MRTIREPARQIVVVDEADVLVVGGGPAGMVAAIAAGRNGVRTLVVERYGFLGGMATNGLVGPVLGIYHLYTGERIVGGIPWEMLRRMEKLGGALLGTEGPYIAFDPEVIKYVADQMTLEAGARMRLHSFASDIVKEGDLVRGVVLESKSGRQAVMARVIIDATGDGDLATWAGAPVEKGRPQDGAMQPMTMYFRLGGMHNELLPDPRDIVVDCAQVMKELRQTLQEAVDARQLPVFGGPWALKTCTVRDGEVGVNMVRVYGDATDVLDLTRVEVEARDHIQRFVAFLQRNSPAFRDCYLYDTAPQIGIRETRRVIGDYVLTSEDILQKRGFDDGIALGGHIIDIHSLDGTSEQLAVRVEPYQIPYRCLLPRGVDNLLVAGRPISATHEAHASLRVMGTCMALGEAAGTAAALAAQAETSPREIGIQELLARLRQQSAMVDASDLL